MNNNHYVKGLSNFLEELESEELENGNDYDMFGEGAASDFASTTLMQKVKEFLTSKNSSKKKLAADVLYNAIKNALLSSDSEEDPKSQIIAKENYLDFASQLVYLLQRDIPKSRQIAAEEEEDGTEE